MRRYLHRRSWRKMVEEQKLQKKNMETQCCRGSRDPEKAQHGPKMAPRWVQDGSKLASKIVSKLIKNRFQKRLKLMHLGIDFGEDCWWFWEPKWGHVGTQRGCKMHLILKAPKIKKNHKSSWNPSTIIQPWWKHGWNITCIHITELLISQLPVDISCWKI